MARVRCWSVGSSPLITAVLTGNTVGSSVVESGSPRVCHDSTESIDAYSATEPAGLGMRFTASSVPEHHHRTGHSTLSFLWCKHRSCSFAPAESSSCKGGFGPAPAQAVIRQLAHRAQHALPHALTWNYHGQCCLGQVSVWPVAFMVLVRVAWGRDWR